jgi:hypothetical protein
MAYKRGETYLIWGLPGVNMSLNCKTEHVGSSPLHLPTVFLLNDIPSGLNYQHSELCKMNLTLFILCILTELRCSFMTPMNASSIYRLQTQSYIASTHMSNN